MSILISEEKLKEITKWKTFYQQHKNTPQELFDLRQSTTKTILKLELYKLQVGQLLDNRPGMSEHQFIEALIKITRTN